MKTYPKPTNFDGAKFAARYGLGPFDFKIVGAEIVVPDGLPDPPIFEGPDDPLVFQRRQAAVLVDDALPQSKLLRAVLAVIFDEMNLHAQKINSILNAIDSATTLADLKTRMAAVPDYPARTMAQAVTAVKNKIDSGQTD